MKKVLSLFAALVLIFALSACTGGSESADKPIIGIIQFGSHGSLNNCYDGIIAGLKENGINPDDYTVEYVNSNFDTTVSQSQAKKLVNENAAVIIGIATPSAAAAANAAADSDIPVVYCAVTDSSTMANFKNITGSSDIPNFDKQLKVVTGVMGRTDLKIGVLYSTEESSSPIQVENLQKAAKAYAGMTVLSSAVADITTIDAKTNDLISQGVDCFVNLLDNTIVGKLETNILPLTNEHKIPVFGSEIEQVKVGCAASASIEYLDVGKAAGKAAAQILGGKNASEIPVATVTDPSNFYNSKVCQQLGLTVPADLAATDVAN